MAIATTIFVASAALVIYLVAGYPVLLAWLSRVKRRPVMKDDVLRPVSIVIAARNGENFIADKLNSILALDYPRDLVEVIVISDGSSDRTDEIARAYDDRGVQVWRLPRGGKATALNFGIAKARNELLVLTDVRQRLARDSVRQLVKCFGDPEVGAASGKLCILDGETDGESSTGLYWKYEVALRKGMSAIGSTFGTNGPFYAMRRALAVPIPTDTLLDDVYLPMAAFFRGYRLILEESAQAFDYPTSLQSEFRRKVRTQAGLFQILRLYPQMLRRQNSMRFHWVSAKFGRLALPWLLLFMLLTSLGLPAPFNTWLFLGQVAFYLIAALDSVLPEWLPFKRATSLARTFVVLVISSLSAVRVFFVAPQKLWKETQVRKVNG
jgi:poly-beta-1,6-N-acetyl-D-glucosamine synthase